MGYFISTWYIDHLIPVKLGNNSSDLCKLQVVYDTATSTHRLTGIGHTPLWIGDQFIKENPYRVPRDKSLAVLGVPGDKTDQNPDLIAVYYESLHWWFYTAEPKRDWRSLAFSIHIRCWNLAQCILGPMVERHLDMFTALMLRKVREWKPGYEETWEDIDGSTGMYLCTIEYIYIYIYISNCSRTVQNRGFQRSCRKEPEEGKNRYATGRCPILQAIIPAS